jgi:2-polyprenyl-3-methyl-5-hydroxy-6-metoxy-1,4-benzoquinol methylase
MSDTDQQKWDQRYTQQVQRETPSPAPWLVEMLPELPAGAALDLACGRGGNAIYLAGHGYAVDAIDISPVGLQLAQEAALSAGVKVNFSCQDLLTDVQISNWHYDLIVMYHFIAPALLARLQEALRPGGVLMVEQHMSGFPSAAGPGSDRFRVAPGALAQAVCGLEVVRVEEGLFSRGEAAPFALSRLLARRVL